MLVQYAERRGVDFGGEQEEPTSGVRGGVAADGRSAPPRDIVKLDSLDTIVRLGSKGRGSVKSDRHRSCRTQAW